MSGDRQCSFTTSDGVRLSYFDAGVGERVIILIAGYGTPAITWELQVPALTAAGYRVISFDRRNHGASENTERGQRIARHGRDLGELIAHLTLSDSVILVGQSMGASTIFAYLAQCGDADVRGIVDIDQTPQMCNSSDWTFGMAGLSAETLPTYFDAPLPKQVVKPLRPEVRRAVLAGIARYPRFDTDTTRPALLDHAAANWRGVLAELGAPILFLAGAKSPMWPPEHATAAAALCSRAQVMVVPECGHAINWEAPELTTDAILSFCAEL